MVILDTCRVVDDLKAYVRQDLDHPPLGTVALAFGSVLYFAPLHVFDEMYRPDNLGNANKFEKLARQSDAEGWSTEASAFRSAWETKYVPKIRFVDPGDIYEDHAFARSISHDADVPTGQLAALLVGLKPVLFSSDKHLRTPGLAPQDLDAVLTATATVEITGGAVAGTGYAVLGAGAAVSGVTNRIAGLLGISPIWIYALMAAAGGFALRDAGRRARMVELGGSLMAAVGDHVATAADAQSVIEAHAIESSAALDLIQHLAMLLGRSSVPLGVAAITGALGTSSGEVLELLEQHPCFVAIGGRWQLGDESISR